MFETNPPASPGKAMTETSAEAAFGPSTLKLPSRISERGCSLQPSGLVHYAGLPGGGTNPPDALCMATVIPSLGILYTSILSLLQETIAIAMANSRTSFSSPNDRGINDDFSIAAV